MYGSFWYYFLDYVNWLPMFMFVSGTSLWFMVNKRLDSDLSRWRISFHGIKRYGSYILLSLLLSLWCFSFQTFLNLNEILGAIGVYVLVTLCILLLCFGNEWIFIPLAFAVYGLSFWFGDLLSFQYYPFHRMLPFFFLGVFYAKFVMNRSLKKSILFKLSLLVVIAGLAFLGDDFSYRENSLGFVILNILLIAILLAIIDRIQYLKILNIFSFIGKNALFFYVFHYAVWFRLAVSLNIYQTFDWPSSILLTCVSIALIFPFAYLKPRLLLYLKKIFKQKS